MEIIDSGTADLLHQTPTKRCKSSYRSLNKPPTCDCFPLLVVSRMTKLDRNFHPTGTYWAPGVTDARTSRSAYQSWQEPARKNPAPWPGEESQMETSSTRWRRASSSSTKCILSSTSMTLQSTWRSIGISLLIRASGRRNALWVGWIKCSCREKMPAVCAY